MNDEDVVQPLVQPLVGISSAFLERHSQDEGLLEWLHDQASAGAPYRASNINLLSFNRAIPCMFYCNIINISRLRRSECLLVRLDVLLINIEYCVSPIDLYVWSLPTGFVRQNSPVCSDG